VLATVNTFAVNYRGEPFVEPLVKNKMLWRSIQGTYLILLVCTFEVFPPLNDLLQLAEFSTVTTDDDNNSSWREILETTMQQSSNPLQGYLALIIKGIVHHTTIGSSFPAFLSLLMITDTVLVFAVEHGIILKVFGTAAAASR
jgi:hypothetical protein